ncbi:glycosyl transferase [Vibrio alfacsensis]|nr:glycosyl transferase [Vibrio alfacsensis]
MTYVDLFLMTAWVLCLFLIIYHHIGYPLLLKYLAKKNNGNEHSLTQQNNADYPSVTVIIPAYNEEQWIADKLRNCAMIDYPRSRLTIKLYCDGCSDNTAEIARETIQEAICSDTLFEIIEYSKNRGKVNILNTAMQSVTTDLTVLTDTSALISIDALQIAKSHFENEKVGVVNGQYVIFNAATEGEDAYWHYQNKIKKAEAHLATTMGSHGAFYILRTCLFEPLDSATINDDFILPMQIVKKGYLSAYDANVVATELEPTTFKNDFSRRVRISAGNMQQIITLSALFNPKFKTIAFAFASGKGLRLLTPYLMIGVFICSFLLRDFPIFEWFLIAQLQLYTVVIITTIFGKLIRFKPLQWLNYLLIGHTANFIGGIKYLLVKRA